MSWFGKLFGGGFGFMLGGPLGALLGVALGHGLDSKVQRFRGRQRVQTAFFTATFSVMGHLAKADGRVSEHEIQMARTLMEQMKLNPTLKKMAIRLFNEGKVDEFPLDEVLDQLKRECLSRHDLMRVFLEIQLQASYADGSLDQAEKKILLHICDRLGFSRAEFDQMEAMLRSGGRGGRSGSMLLEDAYKILDVSKNASDAEVKKAYRKLTSQHHPDKLVAKGLPEEMMKIAADKTHEIRTAFEVIKKEREQ
ncbi:DnaJ-like protein DjlA [hydrothermal vent metagenome]|uniref:DnaJ-like protein DjlA n=1 Tax=hydrothermal vent metagenome TaxID=652676 RepID=A0A3B0ZAC9_9ZZZZ